MKLDDLGKTPKLSQLNKVLMESTKKPRISGLNIYFLDTGEVQANLTVSIGNAGMGYGNLLLNPNDERLAAAYDIIAEILDKSP
ncbi:MAG: hypothetical protein OXH46_09740 [Gemmatimonadetes bacterium]|nr:hypothetical protein [Gemmatimonadota bacterium]